VWFDPAMLRVLVVAALALVLAAPAHAAGRCGDAAQRPWCDTTKDPDTRAGLLLGALTRDEKISLLGGEHLEGVAGAEGTHTGTSDGVPRVGLPPVYFSDGPVGTRQGKATNMPAPMALAASFDPRLARRHAAVVGDEVKRKGNDVVFGPAINMLRTPLNGRTFEYFGEDPFLSARMAVAWTKGVQGEGVMADVKHYAANNQEGAPSPAQVPGAPVGQALTGSRMTVDVRVDERTLREIYLPHFEAAVKEGGAASVMCAYPRINGEYACENGHLLDDVLKRDWAFKGFVLTDYGAAKQVAPSLNNGLDLDIWPGLVYSPANVQAALAAGQASESTIDEHVRRILRTLFAFGFFDRAAYADDTASIDQGLHDRLAADIEQEGIVLLRNERGLLPLDAAKTPTVALIGPEADKIRNGGGSSKIDAFKTTTPKAALEAKLGAGRVRYDDGSDAARAAAVAKAADVAIVVVGDSMSEGSDKPCMGLDCGAADSIDRDALIAAVAAAQPKTVVVLQSGGPVTTPWRSQVPALLEAWYPGQNGGTAITRVLFGDAEPGGRLPATFPAAEADEPTAGDPEAYPGVGETVRYKEGVLIGYRWFDAKRKDVAFPFGFGLGYTTFAFSGLRLEPSKTADARVSVVVKNTGARSGAAVPELYVGMPAPAEGGAMPPWQLKGFKRVTIRPGRSRRVSFALDERAFSHWNTPADRWDVTPGCYRIGVGASSRDLPLQGTIARAAGCAGALSLPRSLRACTSRRVLSIMLPRRLRRAARVTFAGRRATVHRRGGRLVARVDLRGLKAGRIVVRVRGRTAAGRNVRQTRVFRTCAPTAKA
jgi:beta-glucosidase